MNEDIQCLVWLSIDFIDYGDKISSDEWVELIRMIGIIENAEPSIFLPLKKEQKDFNSIKRCLEAALNKNIA